MSAQNIKTTNAWKSRVPIQVSYAWKEAPMTTDVIWKLVDSNKPFLYSNFFSKSLNTSIAELVYRKLLRLLEEFIMPVEEPSRPNDITNFITKLMIWMKTYIQYQPLDMHERRNHTLHGTRPACTVAHAAWSARHQQAETLRFRGATRFDDHFLQKTSPRCLYEKVYICRLYGIQPLPSPLFYCSCINI